MSGAGPRSLAEALRRLVRRDGGVVVFLEVVRKDRVFLGQNASFPPGLLHASVKGRYKSYKKITKRKKQ